MTYSEAIQQGYDVDELEGKTVALDDHGVVQGVIADINTDWEERKQFLFKDWRN